MEVLVSVTVLGLMMVLIADLMTRTQDTVTRASSHATEFQEARQALDSMTHSLSQATMDAVWGYQRASAADPTAITGYERVSDHHFILGAASDLLPADAERQPEAGQAVFFQAPLGKVRDGSRRRLHHLMNNCGYYIQHLGDIEGRPEFLKEGAAVKLNPERKRFRLMQYLQPAEDNTLYSSDLELNRLTNRAPALQWYQADLADASRPVADNILALVLTPYVANVEAGSGNTTVVADAGYAYDSRGFQWEGLNSENQSRRHQLPPMVGITLITADEHSYEALALRLGEVAAAAAVRAVLEGKFLDCAKLKEELAEVEKGLAELPLHHKILSANVALRGSKWITENEQ